MAVVLKITEHGEVHRVRLGEAPTYESLDLLLRELWPRAGASGGCGLARYFDEEGDACLLTKATFSDFLQTARSPLDNVCPVLRLEVRLPPPEAPWPGNMECDAVRRPRAAEGDCQREAPPAASREASSEASWLCLDDVGARSASDDGSWVCAGGRSAEEARGKADSCGSVGNAPSSLSSGWVTPCSRAESNQQMRDESGPSEASFERLGLHLAELRADDWCSSVGSLSEPEAGEAAPPAAAARTPPTAAADTAEAAAAAAAMPAASNADSVNVEVDSDEARAVEAGKAAAEALPTDLADLFRAPKMPVQAGDLEAACGEDREEERATEPRPREEGAVAGAPGVPVPPTPVPTAPRHRRPAAAGASAHAAGRRGGPAAGRPAAPAREANVGNIVHMGHICDGCEACPLPGPRFTCKVCGDFDLCWTCYMRKEELPEPHDPKHHFQQVLWSREVVQACPGGCGHGVTRRSTHPTHCCERCAEAPGQHSEACLEANAHDDEMDP